MITSTTLSYAHYKEIIPNIFLKVNTSDKNFSFVVTILHQISLMSIIFTST